MFFVSPIMKYNYDLFGGVVLIDSTYQTNIYNVPLVIFSGIACDGKNIIFEMLSDDYIDEKFRRYLKTNGLEVQYIIGDGNCMFRSCRSHSK